jgi:hypothetical protein
VLTGRQVSQAMKVFIVSQAGKVADVTLQSSCHSEDESVLKVRHTNLLLQLQCSELLKRMTMFHLVFTHPAIQKRSLPKIIKILMLYSSTSFIENIIYNVSKQLVGSSLRDVG